MIVLFSASPTLISQAIRFGTQFHLSHVGAYCPVEDKVYEAKGGIGGITKGELIKSKFHEFAKGTTQLEVRWLPDADINQIKAELGAPFDFWQGFASFVRFNIDAPDKWFCSEIVAKSSKRIKAHERKFCTPRDIYFQTEAIRQEKLAGIAPKLWFSMKHHKFLTAY